MAFNDHEDDEGIIDPRELHPEIKELFLAYRDTFSSSSGQKVLEDLKKSWQDKTTFVKGDIHETLMNEGARKLYLTILTMIESGKAVSQQTEVEVGRNRPVTEVIT